MVSAVLRAAAICVPAEFFDPPSVLAEPAAPATLTAAIPAQPLAQALAAFARQTGLQLVYVSETVRDQRSHAVPAGLDVNAALARLLEGTGTRFEHLTPNSVRIFAVTLPETRAATAAVQEPAEVIVTANRREEKLQDVPITIQTISRAQLQQLSVTTFNDVLTYTTNVTYGGNGPGTGNIFVRGLAGTGSGNQGQSTTAIFPNVAVYLDDQALQFPQRNADVYVVDMERIEVLEGPQGTLFGGGAQAGVIRYITNKPNLSATSGEFTAGYGTTAGGDNNSQLNGVLNLPLIPDVLALRAVVYNEHQGGYISNVPSTISYLPGSNPAVFGGNPIADNATLLKTNANPLDYQGMRLSLLWKMSENWDFLLQQNYQDMDAEGWFYAYPQDSNATTLQPYQITAFTPAYTKDRYSATAWTITGKLGGLKLIYTGSYLSRNVEGQQDYSNYLRSPKGQWYGCIGPNAGYFNISRFPSLVGKPTQCYAPVADWMDTINNKHESHELRVSTSEDNRLRGLAGVYWEKFVIYDEMNFNYLSIPQCTPQNLASALAGGPDCLSSVGPLPGTFANNTATRQYMNTAFGEDDQRGYKQTAVFASLDFDLIPKTLTLSAGLRWFKYDNFEYGSEFYSESTSPLLLDHANGSCTQANLCGFPINLHGSEEGSRGRINLTWHITPDVMTYYTFSQGFRPGSFNRTASTTNGEVTLQAEAPAYCAPGTPACISNPNYATSDQYLKPARVNSDNLINNEIGLKSEFFDHRMLLNLSAYYMKWEDVQLSLFSQPFFGEATFNVQGPNYDIKGFEVQFVARITDGLTLQGSSSFNKSNQSNAPCLESVGVTSNKKTANNPTSAGQCISMINGVPTPNVLGAYNEPLAFSPEWMFNVRARYDWAAGSFRPFIWAGASHVDSMTNNPRNLNDGNLPQYLPPNTPDTTLLVYTIPGYTTYHGAIGVSKDKWTAQLIGENLSNEYGPSNISSGQYIKAYVPLRPRVLMAQLSYRF